MAKNDEKVKELLERAEQGTKEIFESDKYRDYLATMAKFHSYSFRNSLLILIQKPEASYVAGYTAWQTKFHRQVQRGEKGIQIVGYTPKKIRVEQEQKDSNGNTIIGADGKPVLDTITKQIPAFTPVYVYDVSQTEGEPLPQLVSELDGSVEAYNDLMTAIKEVSPFPIVFEDIQGGAKGYCNPVAQKIAINNGMSEMQNVKTAIHEVTHADLHAPELNLTLNERTDRRTREIEAESTAFVVCSHYGIDTSDYTFPYLATWSSTRELKELQSSLETIQKQAGELIDRIDTRLTELQKDHEQQLVPEVTPEQPDNSVTIAEMEQYGFVNNPAMGINMLPLDQAKATELFQKDLTVYMLYSDSTSITADGTEQIKEHADKGGIFGVQADVWTQQQKLESTALSIAEKYDRLIGDDPIARQAHPFSITDQEQRLPLIADRIGKYDIASLDLSVDQKISRFPDDQDEQRNATIRELQSIKSDYEQFQQEKLTLDVANFDGEPAVSIKWSENPTLENGQTMPLHEANALFRRLDEAYPQDMGYEKTAFYIKYQQGGEMHVYEGRQDFGDRDGGVIDHIKSLWEYELTPEMQAQHIAHGNTELIESAREAVETFVPYLQMHDNLGQLEDMTWKQLVGRSLVPAPGAELTGNDPRTAYYNAVLNYVKDCRAALNSGAELPQLPDREQYEIADMSAEDKALIQEISEYQEQIRKEISSEAKAAGITEDQYVTAGSVPPAGRTYAIYQMKNNDLTRGLKFEGLDYLRQENVGVTPSLDMYDLVYSGTLPEGKDLDDIFAEFNINHPADFKGHSLSVSDIVAIEWQGTYTANFVDSYGFENLPEFAKEIATEKDKSIEVVYGHFYYDNKYLFSVADEKAAKGVYDDLCSAVRNMGYFWSDSGKMYLSTEKQAVLSDSFNADKSPKGYIPYTQNLCNNHLEALSLEYDSLKQDQQRRKNETLDSVKFDNDIDLDREKTREQLGFQDNDKKPQQKRMSMKDRFAEAQAEAERRENDRARAQQNKTKEREEI